MSEATPLRMIDFQPQDIPLEDFDISQRNCGLKIRRWNTSPGCVTKRQCTFVKTLSSAYWSLTRYADIMEVDSNWQDFSSEPAITIIDPEEDFPLPMFIAMDPPKHDDQRKTVQGAVAPANLKNLESTIRGRVQKVLDDLPVGEEFDWVDRVSIELPPRCWRHCSIFPLKIGAS